jgi:hypothetical protein
MSVIFECLGTTCQTLIYSAQFTLISDIEIQAIMPDVGEPESGYMQVSTFGGASNITEASAFTYT